MTPSHAQKRLAISSDHAGIRYKTLLKETAEKWGYDVMDYGTSSHDSVDYPDYIDPIVKEVLKGAKGVLICGSGIGMSIGANRFFGVRAALCMNRSMAKLARQHNDANILILGERFIQAEEAVLCLEAFLNTSFEGGRHEQRVEKLEKLNK